MIKINIADAKAKLSAYLDRAERGERIVICRHNKPVAELRAVAETRTEPRPVGPLPNRPAFDVPASFFEPLPDDELELWEGGSQFDSAVRGRRTPRVAESKTTFGKSKRTNRRRS